MYVYRIVDNNLITGLILIGCRLKGEITSETKELAQGTLIEKQQLNLVTKKITIYAPDIAAKARAGQFVILKSNRQRKNSIDALILEHKARNNN